MTPNKFLLYECRVCGYLIACNRTYLIQDRISLPESVSRACLLPNCLHVGRYVSVCNKILDGGKIVPRAGLLDVQ